MPELAGDSGSAGITCCAALLSQEAGGSDKASEGILLLVLSGASAGTVGSESAHFSGGEWLSDRDLVYK